MKLFYLKLKNISLKTTCYACLLYLTLAFSAYAQRQSPFKILFIPLDDRPPCLQFPEKMGLIGHVQLVSPPKALLGKFTDVGKSDDIVRWIAAQPLHEFEAAIISMDMLAYGGLVGSRVYDVTPDHARRRVEIINLIRQKAPTMKIYGSSVIMRLAPTADGKNEAYREKLSKWAEISLDETQAEATRKLEKEIPTEALKNYQEARRRNLIINQLAIDLIEKNIMDYLILSQDDAKPKGVHVGERERLWQAVTAKNLTSKIAIQPGADEVSMLLLARAIAEKYQYHPKIKAIYASESMADQVMPFEDRPLRKTVSFHLKSVGAIEVENVAEADLLFYVFSSRFETGRAESFANEIILQSKNPQKGIIIADVDPKGDVQGGDVAFTETLRKARVFDKIYGYACWNTAGNTIGTALPHGFVYGFSQQKLTPKLRKQLQPKQKWFVMNRLLDDYAYHSLVRPKANAFIRERGWNPYRLTHEQTPVVEVFCKKSFGEILKTYPVRNFRFYLPWNRTFEAEIDFDVK